MTLCFEVCETAVAEEPLLVLWDSCHRGTFIVSFMRQLPQRNVYCEFCETSATEESLLLVLWDSCHRGTFIVTFVRQLPRRNRYCDLWDSCHRNLYCEFCETAATEEPLLWVLCDSCHRAVSFVKQMIHVTYAKESIFCI